MLQTKVSFDTRKQSSAVDEELLSTTISLPFTRDQFSSYVCVRPNSDMCSLHNALVILQSVLFSAESLHKISINKHSFTYV